MLKLESDAGSGISYNVSYFAFSPIVFLKLTKTCKYCDNIIGFFKGKQLLFFVRFAWNLQKTALVSLNLNPRKTAVVSYTTAVFRSYWPTVIRDSPHHPFTTQTTTVWVDGTTVPVDPKQSPTGIQTPCLAGVKIIYLIMYAFGVHATHDRQSYDSRTVVTWRL